MSFARKLGALRAIAAIRREAALQDLAIAAATEKTARGVLEDLAAKRAAAIVSAEATDALQLERYCRWTDTRRHTVAQALATAASATECCRQRAALALGRTTALARIERNLAAKLRTERSRRV